MPKLELLDSITHARLMLRPRGEPDPHFVQVVASEFAAAASCCPIVFTKQPQTGAFYTGVMFGLQPGDTLLADAASRGGFQPLALQRDGFFISEEKIVVDLDHPRISASEGEPLFDDAHMPSPGLRRVQRALGQVQTGLDQTERFIRTLMEFKLIEPMDVTLAFRDRKRIVLEGLYTVSLDAFRDLDDSAVLQLVRAGYAQLMYVMNASLHHIGRFASLRDAQIENVRV